MDVTVALLTKLAAVPGLLDLTVVIAHPSACPIIKVSETDYVFPPANVYNDPLPLSLSVVKETFPEN